jgi:heme/copper-type cytochrome/quinol oxidase subunit 1
MTPAITDQVQCIFVGTYCIFVLSSWIGVIKSNGRPVVYDEWPAITGILWRVSYSAFKLFTGFMSAALIDWKLMVSRAISMAANPARANTQ